MNEKLVSWLEDCADSGLEAVCDLGCGGLEWVSQVPAVLDGRLAYHGIDVKQALIFHHERVFGWFRGEALDAETVFDEKGGREAEVVIVNDLLDCMCNGAAGQVLTNVSRWKRWRRLLVSTVASVDNDRRRGVRGGRKLPYNVEAGLLTEQVRLGTPTLRMQRPSGAQGEWLVWVRG